MELSVKQNLFIGKLGQEKKDTYTKYQNIPVVIKGEDLYLKSGASGLMTDNI